MNINELIEDKSLISEKVFELETLNNKFELLFLTQKDKGKEYIIEVLQIIRDVYKIDNKFYILNIFFDFFAAIKKLEDHKQRVHNELAQLSRFTVNSIEEKTHLVNIYRNIVSDLFDPYISLLLASIQYKEGKFTSFLDSNLGQKELTKYEYLYSRLKPTNLFEGYNSIVRNAISHTGTEGITYKEKEILFKSINRGNPPKVKSILWKTEELHKNILSLLYFIYAIDISIEIFGLEIRKVVSSDKEIHDKFLDQILNTEQRIGIQKNIDSIIFRINESDISIKEKMEFYSNLFFLECGKREILVDSIGVKDNSIFIKIPFFDIDINKDDELINRLIKMIRYAIIAEPCFRYICEKIIIYELDIGENEKLRIVCCNKDLKNYGEEIAGLYDLLNDSNFYFEKKEIPIEVDFEKIEEIENTTLSRIFPRKNRD